MPGNNAGMLQSGDALGADVLIFDLEDAVALEEKDAARDLVAEALRSLPRRQSRVAVRLNPTDSPFWQEDLEVVLPAGPDALIVPKALPETLGQLAAWCEGRGLSLPPLWPLLESPRAIVEAAAIAQAHPLVEALLLGGEDYANTLGLSRTPGGQEIAYARNVLVTTARAYELDAVDTPFTDLADPAGLAAEVAAVRALGFTGKLAIHPGQLAIINRGFAPTAEEIEWANALQGVARDAAEQGLGVFSFRGKMVDRPVLQRAQAILQAAGRSRT